MSWVVVAIMFTAGVACLVIAASGTSPAKVWAALYQSVTGSAAPGVGTGSTPSTPSTSPASPASSASSAASSAAAALQRAAAQRGETP